MGERIKRYFFPTVSADVQKDIDSDSIRNVRQVTFAMALFELIALFVFMLTSWPLDQSEWISVGGVTFCAVSCLLGCVCSNRMMRKGHPSHASVTALKLMICIVFSVWAILVSYRQYIRGEQLLTFYAVELLLVCFIPLRPVTSMGLVCAVHASLYATLYSIDGAQGIHPYNYAVFILASIAGTFVRYWSQVRISVKSVQLQRSNDMLEHANRHDSLTGLRNRRALEEDMQALAGQNVTAYMLDINYFKEINDTYGHAVGDAVLRETAGHVRALFPGGFCYRYGGDEFLVLGSAEGAYAEDVYTFTVSAVPNCEILLSIGRASGVPEDHAQLFDLIDQADVSLYITKRRTHSLDMR